MIKDFVRFKNIGNSTLEAVVEIKAPPEKVFKAWTNESEFVKWFCPRVNGHTEVSKFDCTVGGEYDVTLEFEDGDRAQVAGIFKEVKPPRKLVLAWQWVGNPDAPDATQVTVKIEPTSFGSRLTLLHEKFTESSIRDQHHIGWEPILLRLQRVLSESV